MEPVRRWCRVTVLAPDGGELATCLLEGPGDPDLRAVDDVARLALWAGRLGGGIVLADLSPATRELLELAGLSVEVEGQAKFGEESLGVQEGQEEGHPRDPSC
jgi:hypothetical protein